jgi:hypothetical protein
MDKTLEDIVGEWQERHKEEFKKERKPEAAFLSESGIPIKRTYRGRRAKDMHMVRADFHFINGDIVLSRQKFFHEQDADNG